MTTTTNANATTQAVEQLPVTGNEINATIRGLLANGYMQVQPTLNDRFTRDAMHAAFTAVQNPIGWKYEIAALIPVEMLCVTVDAIGFFAGSETYIKLAADQRHFVVYSPGYHARIGC